MSFPCISSFCLDVIYMLTEERLKRQHRHQGKSTTNADPVVRNATFRLDFLLSRLIGELKHARARATCTSRYYADQYLLSSPSKKEAISQYLPSPASGYVCRTPFLQDRPTYTESSPSLSLSMVCGGYTCYLITRAQATSKVPSVFNS